MNERPQEFGEEIANSISHGLGFLLAVAALPILTLRAAESGSVRNVIAASIFAVTMIVLYLVSTLYHALPASRAKAVLCRLDHAAIYLFIAGSYTPFAFGVLWGGSGWAIFAVVWVYAAFGVVAKALNRLRHPLWSTGLYVAMGWLALAVLQPLIERMPAAGIGFLVAGGAAYTVGALVYLLDNRVRYAHFVWHLFVVTGSVCHFFAALWYAA
jgi:hemolysin III